MPKFLDYSSEEDFNASLRVAVKATFGANPNVAIKPKPKKKQWEDSSDSEQEEVLPVIQAQQTEISSSGTSIVPETLSSDDKVHDDNHPSKHAEESKRKSNASSSKTNQQQQKTENSDTEYSLEDIGVEVKPLFDDEFNQEDSPLCMPAHGDPSQQSICLNRYSARCLIDHQVIGVKWLYERYCRKEGAILGDDMVSLEGCFFLPTASIAL
jgi:hypothetical protein